MRTVVKTVLRSLSASASSEIVSVESQTKTDMSAQWRRRDERPFDNVLSSLTYEPREISKPLSLLKTESLSPLYTLSGYEETCFEELQDKECDYYPNNSCRGDINVLNMDLKNNINEQNVNSNNIISSLKNICFVNTIVFNQKVNIFLTTANYIQRLLHIKAVKKDLMPFISVAMYDLAFEHKIGKCMTRDQVTLFLSLSDIPINHIEDFFRMKALLKIQLNNDLNSISIIDYLELLLKINFSKDTENMSDSHNQLRTLVCILATSCELSHFTLACQAITLVNIAARHVSFNKSFSNQFSSIIGKLPMIFVSPVRLHQFSKLDNVNEENIKECAECIVRYISKYYYKSGPLFMTEQKKSQLNLEERPKLYTIIEEEEIVIPSSQQTFDIVQLIDKLEKVRVALSSQVNGKQKQRHKTVKKKLRRQLKKCDTNVMMRTYKSWIVEDHDSAISSSSNITSPTNSPLTF